MVEEFICVVLDEPRLSSNVEYGVAEKVDKLNIQDEIYKEATQLYQEEDCTGELIREVDTSLLPNLLTSWMDEKIGL